MTKHLLAPRAQLFSLYRDVYTLTEKGQHEQAFSQVCDTLGIEMDPVSHRAFELVLGKLCEVKRFEGNPHIGEKRRGTTGQHTMMVMPLIAIVGDMALGQSKTVANFNGISWGNGEEVLKDTVRSMCVMALMHDLGEEVCELSSLSQRRKAEKVEDQPKLERKIAEFSMRLAYRAALSSNDPATQKLMFDREIDAMRTKVDPTQQHAEEIVGMTIGKQIEQSIDEITTRLHLDTLPQAALAPMHHFMAQYEEPEGLSQIARFNGVLVKHCENMQTILHILEHADRGDAAPYSLANSGEVRASLWYVDRGLGKLHKAANPSNPIQQALARAGTEMAYAINLGLLDMPVPCMIDRDARMKFNLKADAPESDVLRAESEPSDVAARKLEIRNAIQRQMMNSNGLIDFSTPELAKGQLEMVYSAGYKLVQAGGYTPPDKALVDCRELPDDITRQMLKMRKPVKTPAIVAEFTGRTAEAPVMRRKPTSAPSAA